MISLKKIYGKFFRKKICTDCKNKLDSQFGLRHKIKHKSRKTKHHIKHHAHKIKHKVSGKIHVMRIKMANGKTRSQKYKVLANGKRRFIKN